MAFAGSENTEDFQGALIEKHIAPVTSHYGGAEYASLASRCPEGVYHVDRNAGSREWFPWTGWTVSPARIRGRSWSRG